MRQKPVFNVFGTRLFIAVILALAFSACSREGMVQRGSENRKSMTNGPIVYVALGDSTGSGVGARDGGYVARLYKRLEELREGSTLVNLCVSGATTADVFRNQLQKSVEADPDLVTLGIGINDVGHGVTLDQFEKDYDEILSVLRENTVAQIVVTNIPDVSTAPRIPGPMRSDYQRRIVQFNRKLEEIAARYGVVVFDIHSITARELPEHPEYFSADGFHPSDAGYELWAREMWPVLERVIVGAK
jgi:lysophospholipase L1-like esterase